MCEVYRNLKRLVRDSQIANVKDFDHSSSSLVLSLTVKQSCSSAAVPVAKRHVE